MFTSRIITQLIIKCNIYQK